MTSVYTPEPGNHHLTENPFTWRSSNAPLTEVERLQDTVLAEGFGTPALRLTWDGVTTTATGQPQVRAVRDGAARTAGDLLMAGLPCTARHDPRVLVFDHDTLGSLVRTIEALEAFDPDLRLYVWMTGRTGSDYGDRVKDDGYHHLAGLLATPDSDTATALRDHLKARRLGTILRGERSASRPVLSASAKHLPVRQQLYMPARRQPKRGAARLRTVSIHDVLTAVVATLGDKTTPARTATSRRRIPAAPGIAVPTETDPAQTDALVARLDTRAQAIARAGAFTADHPPLGEDKSRSPAEITVIHACLRADLSETEIATMFAALPIGARMAANAEPGAYLARRISDARRYQATGASGRIKGGTPNTLVVEAVDEWWAWVLTQTSETTALQVAAAIGTAFIQARDLEANLGYRAIALLAGVDRHAVADAVAAGVPGVEVIRAGNERSRLATRWRLLPTFYPCSDTPRASREPGVTRTGVVTVCHTDAGAGGLLRGTAPLVLTAVTEGAVSVREVLAMVPRLSQSAVYRGVSRLRDLGLLVTPRRGVLTLGRSLDAVALELGVSGALAARRAEYAVESALHQVWVDAVRAGDLQAAGQVHVAARVTRQRLVDGDVAGAEGVLSEVGVNVDKSDHLTAPRPTLELAPVQAAASVSPPVLSVVGAHVGGKEDDVSTAQVVPIRARIKDPALRSGVEAYASQGLSGWWCLPIEEPAEPVPGADPCAAPVLVAA